MTRQSSRPEPLVVCSHLPREGHFESERFKVVGVECTDDFDYWRALERAWSTDATIVNCEHDIEVTDAHVQSLLDCPHPLCSWAYRCHWISTHIDGGVIAAGAGARDIAAHPDAYYLQGGEEWATWSAIGLVKITAEARVGLLRREPWSQLELAVGDAVLRPWHMHGNGSLAGDVSGHVIHHHW